MKIASRITLALILGTLSGCSTFPGIPVRSLTEQYRAANTGTIEGAQARLNALRALAASADGETFVFSEIDGAYPRDLPTPPPHPTLSVWSEFIPYPEVKASLPQLKAQNLSLFLAVPAGKLQDPTLYDLLAAARTQGVDVRPWLLLAPVDGYWANKWNYEAVRGQVLRFLQELNAHRLSVSWLILDIEAPPALNQKMFGFVKDLDLLGLYRFLSEKVKQGSLEEAKKAYTSLLEETHRQGIKIQAVTNPLVLDDLGQRRASIQAALGLPIAGVPWDEVSFMAYRPEFSRMAGGMGSDIVYRYARDAVRYYGEGCRLDLGEVGTVGYPVPAHGFSAPLELKKDLGAAYAAGVGDLDVYSLDGILQQGGLQTWMNTPVSQKPDREVKAALLRYFLGLASHFLPEK